MRRAASILLGILLGALASGIGVGIFLKKANADREALVQKMMATVRDATSAREKTAEAILDANAKLKSANQEVAKAQAVIKALQDERVLLARAIILSYSQNAVRGWADVVAFGQGLSLKIPAGNQVEINDASALTVSTKRVTGSSSDDRWLSITPYSEQLERDLLSTLTTSTAVTYLVRGRIMDGVSGPQQNGGAVVTLVRARSQGMPTHLIWIREPFARGVSRSNTVALNVLGTLNFQAQ